MILPVIAAALALTGAPSSIPVTCDASITTLYQGAYGVTWFDWSDGIPRATGITYIPYVCGGALLMGASSADRRRIARLNRIDVDTEIGESALVLLHESEHAAKNDQNETRTECRAMALLPRFPTSL